MPSLQKLKISSKGFTLIELMIAISIIAIISIVGLISYSKAQSLGRDAKRKQDLASIVIALELYNQKNKTHPPLDRDYDTGADGCVSAALLSHLEGEFINKLPEDPLRTNYGGFLPTETDWCYWYIKTDLIANRKTYTLYARLENPVPATDPNGCKPEHIYRNDGTFNKYNYCLSP